MPGSPKKFVKPQAITAKEAELQQQFGALPQDPLSQRRLKAQQCFLEKGLPTRKHEDWQFTPLTHLYTHLPASAHKNIPDFDVFDIGDFACIEVFDGHINLPAESANMRFSVGQDSLPIDGNDDALFLLNQAFLQDHVHVQLKGQTTLWIRYLGTQASTAATQIDLTIADNAEITLIETHGKGYGQAMSNHTLGACVGANAVFKHFKWQDQHGESQHFSHQFFHLKRDAVIQSTSILAGAALCRQNNFTRLAEPGANSDVNSLYLGQKSQLIESRTFTRHMAPNCRSYQIHKGILDDRAKGIFQGRIFVDPCALKTDGQMDNKALLLSPTAENNSKPQLEIYADDVKCSHGFTCGQMDKDQLFYMQSRGISKERAELYLIYAFAADVVENIDYMPMRQAIDDKLFDQLLK